MWKRKDDQVSKYKRQNDFYHEHSDDKSYKYMKKYSTYKSMSKSFVRNMASKPDLIDLRNLIDQRLSSLKGLDKMMEETLSVAYKSGMHLAKELGNTRRGFAMKLTNDLHPLSLNPGAKTRQEVINSWSSDYLTACIQAGVPAFDAFTVEDDIEKKIKIAFAITGAMTGDPE